MTKTYTAKQGQYLAFFYYYTEVNGQPPAETDIARYFGVTPESAHGMIVTLEKRGFITKIPWQAGRSGSSCRGRSCRIWSEPSGETTTLPSPRPTPGGSSEARARVVSPPETEPCGLAVFAPWRDIADSPGGVMTDWLFYWRPDQLRGEGETIDSAFSARYKLVAVGDTAWFVTVRDERLLLLGRLVVDRVGPGLFDYDEVRAYARDGTVVTQTRLDVTHLVPQLTMASRTTEVRISGNALQRPRPFTEESARLLREFWDKNGTAPVPADPQPSRRWVEGARVRVEVNRYERETSPDARRACLAAHGKCCWVCGFDFEEVYGALGSSFIYLHHRIPVAVRAAGGEYQLDPVRDLVPLCGNCHPMVHIKEPTLADVVEPDGGESDEGESDEGEADEGEAAEAGADEADEGGAAEAGADEADVDRDATSEAGADPVLEDLIGRRVRFEAEDGMIVVGVVTELHESTLTVEASPPSHGVFEVDLEHADVDSVSFGLSELGWKRLRELRREAAWDSEPRPVTGAEGDPE